MNKVPSPEQSTKPNKRTRSTAGRALAATAALALLAACSSSPSDGVERSSHKPATPVEVPVKPRHEVKLSPEAQALTEQAQSGAEALAAKIYDKYLNSPTKDTYNRVERDSFYDSLVGINQDTGKEVNGWPYELHIHATLGRDVYTGDINPDFVDTIDISFRRKVDGIMADYDANFEFQLWKDKKGWKVGYEVDPGSTSYEGFPTPEYSTSDPNGTLKSEQLAYYLDVANRVVNGEITFDQLPTLVLPADTK